MKKKQRVVHRTSQCANFSQSYPKDSMDCEDRGSLSQTDICPFTLDPSREFPRSTLLFPAGLTYYGMRINGEPKDHEVIDSKRRKDLPEGLGVCVSRLDSVPPSRSFLTISDGKTFVNVFSAGK